MEEKKKEKKPSKADEYKAKLKAIEAEEKRIAELPASSLREILEEVTKVEWVEVPELGKRLPYRRIGIRDFIEVQKRKDTMAVTYGMLFYFLHGGDESVTEEDVARIPFDMASDMVSQMTKRTPFLQAKAMLDRRSAASRTTSG